LTTSFPGIEGENTVGRILLQLVRSAIEKKGEEPFKRQG